MKRIYILSHKSIFLEGIETLLSQEAGFEIVGRETDASTAVANIEKFKPDVILINCDDPETDLSPAVECILRKRLDIRIIGLSLKDNSISIYRGEDQQVLQVEDLVKAISI